MLEFTGKIFSIHDLIEQVSGLEFGKRLSLNEQTGSFFGKPWKTFDYFTNTPIGHVLDKLSPIGEARLMKLSSSETYTAHADPDNRYQLSIITNEYSYLVDLSSNKLIHLPADGKLWKMDTSVIHSAVNFGGRDRIHLNVRLLLPEINMSDCVSIKVEGGDWNWKYESYKILMPFINKAICDRSITGFEKITEREILVNISDKSMLNPIFQELSKKGFMVTVS